MEGLFSSRTFTGFGPCGLAPAAGVPSLHQVHASRPSGLRMRVRQECPRRPGVYGMVNGDGELIYVGKAKCLRTRLFSYFRPRSRDPRAGKILENARTLVWEYAPSEFAALLRELELIRRWQPRLNIKNQPRRQRRVYVCLGRQPAPYVFLTSRPSSRVLACFGPVPASRSALEAVRRINDAFLLRDCPQAQEMIFADQQELFPVLRAAGCVRYEIGTCLGPCAAVCTHSGYAEQVKKARAFLEGTNLSLLQTLVQAMTEASAAMAFERAAALRDKLGVLQWLNHHLQLLREAREKYSFIYPVEGHNRQDLWYLIHLGRVQAVVPRPRDDESKRTAAKGIEAVFHRQAILPSAPSSGEMDGVLLVMSWFRKHAQEMTRLLDPDAALVLCRGVQMGRTV